MIQNRLDLGSKMEHFGTESWVRARCHLWERIWGPSGGVLGAIWGALGGPFWGLLGVAFPIASLDVVWGLRHPRPEVGERLGGG